MTDTAESLPTDLAAAHAMILAERAARLSAESDRRVLDIEIERLKLEIARLKRERYGQSAERSARIEQLELSLEDLEESAAAIEAAAVSETAPPQPRRKPARRPLPDHLPRLRVVEPAPASCPCCGGELSKLGEDVTETLERITAACQAFIDTVLKPRFLPVITPTKFNYPINIQGKWHGSKYRFLQRYRSGFADNLGEEFDAPFTRLDWMGRDRFDVQWHRHTGQWFLIHQGLTLKAALRAIETNEFLHPV